jgi:hypothetical protein
MPDKNEIHITCGTRRSIYMDYCTDYLPEVPISEPHFYKILEQEYPTLKFPKKSLFAKCSDCDKIKGYIEAAKTRSRREELKAMLLEHRFGIGMLLLIFSLIHLSGALSPLSVTICTECGRMRKAMNVPCLSL